MKLFVTNPVTKEKHYLKQLAPDKPALAQKIGSISFQIDGHIFSVDDVLAESSDNTAGAMAAGGVVGVAAGVPGVIIGGLIGMLLGKSSGDEDKAKAEKFNRSSI